MREPDLRQLRYFVAVAEELHFGRAAQRVGIAQPPLSQQIRQLEEIIGQPLLERRPAVRLTPAGETMLEVARTTLREIRTGLEIVQKTGKEKRGSIRIGISASTLLGPLPGAIRLFRVHRPGISVALAELSSYHQVEALKRGEIDLGYVREPSEEDDLITELIRTESFRVALPPGHRLADRSHVRLEDLAEEPFVLFPRMVAPNLYDQIQALFAGAGYRPRVVQEVYEWMTILGFVAAGEGISIVPDSFRGSGWPELRFPSISNITERTRLGLCRAKGPVSEEVAAFLEVARAVLLKDVS